MSAADLFFVDGVNASLKPALKERRAIETVRRRGFDPANRRELRTLLCSLFELTWRDVIDSSDEDDFSSRLRDIDSVKGQIVFQFDEVEDVQSGATAFRIIPHCFFWKRLGFTAENPEIDFFVFKESVPPPPTPAPLHRFEKINPDEGLTPSGSHWLGGLLSMDCLLFFLQHPRPCYRERAHRIISSVILPHY